MIFARVDVELRDHAKAHRAGTAMATWTWALLWTRAKEEDGYVSRACLRGAWVGERQALADMKKLVAVGLAEETSSGLRADFAATSPGLRGDFEGGWRLLGYAERNETKAAISARRQAEADRKASFRSKKADVSRGDITVTPSRDIAGTSAGVPLPESESSPESESESDLKREIPLTPTATARTAVSVDWLLGGPGPSAPAPPSAPEPEPEAKAPKSRATRPRGIPGDWEPDPEAVAKLVAKHRVAAADILGRVDTFRDYWLGTGKTKADWAATFRNWIASDVENGKLVPSIPARPVPPEEPEKPDLRTPEERAEDEAWFVAALENLGKHEGPPPHPRRDNPDHPRRHI